MDFDCQAAQRTRLLPRVGWPRCFLEFCCFLALFSAYDVIVWSSAGAHPHGVSLINYVVRDGRTDESAMYWPFVREVANGNFATTDPYLVEYQHASDIKPRIPTWLCAPIYRSVGSVNLAVLVIHSLFPALAAILLIQIGAPFIGRNAALATTLLSVAGAAFAFNDLVDALSISDLGGPHRYNVIEHWYSGSGLHMEFQRFFSPGLTLTPFLLGVWLLARDTFFQRRRTLILAGLILGLHTEIYIHGGVTLLVLVVSLIALQWIHQSREVGLQVATLTALRNSFVFMGVALFAGLPWLLRYQAFREQKYANEIMFRVGNFDFTPDINRLPILAWMLLAIYLRHIAAYRARQNPQFPQQRFLADPLDRFWTALILTTIGAGWFAGIAGELGYFPSSHLICYRYLAYLAPLIVAYPLGLLLQPWLADCGQQWKWASKGFTYFATASVLALIVHGEVSAARNCSHLYAIPPEVARLRDEVVPATPSRSEILTDDLRLTSYLVCETNRKTYIGYASVSLAPTGELIDRLMIPSILLGRPFSEFERDHYRAGRGLPHGPNGQHWVLHHGGDIQPVPQQDLAARYAGLQQLSVEDLFHRYRFDYAYFPDRPPVQPYAARLKLSEVPGLYERANPE